MGLLSGIRVLIVEDDEDNRFLLQESLQVLGAAVEAVPTAGDAVDVLKRFDVIVADYDLPDHDGVWLLEQATRLAPSVPVICLSGYAESQLDAIAMAPFVRKLLKPVDPADLGVEIVKALAVRKESPGPPHAVRKAAG
jgi:two-component system, OmpR family, response regulator